jgi:hypothetical protein
MNESHRSEGKVPQRFEHPPPSSRDIALKRVDAVKKKKAALKAASQFSILLGYFSVAVKNRRT